MQRTDARLAHALGIVFSAIYLVLLIVFCLRFGVYPRLEFFVAGFLIYAIHRKWSRRFMKDWAPFTTLFMAYEAMYGIADNVSAIVHVNELISAEFLMFGAIPTLMLQQFYRNPIFDYVGAFFYSLHFIAPTTFGFILWKRSPKDYWRYSIAFLLCSYGALMTFVMYPSAPPWFGLKASRILFQIDREIGVPVYSTIIDYVQPNPFAAFPSLHAAYPWLISIYAIKIKRVKALPILLIPAGVWFSAVYLGEHYIVDLLGGVAYSTFAFVFVEKLLPRFRLGKRS
ncbi:MAG: inositol phosphorylceramide synthase [Candidatus Brockarchaeota archaeon]|nr:inositol phosphorylceramide synthase [Candidatus Brockarchaeota archaeon]